MTITLTDDLEELIDEEIKSGAYESADDVIRAGLRLLKAREEGVQALRKEILLGFEDIQSGRFTSFDSDEELGVVLGRNNQTSTGTARFASRSGCLESKSLRPPEMI